MPEKSGRSPSLTTPQTMQGLSAQQRSLVETMCKYQFGRVENLPVRDGQPILDAALRIVRVVKLGVEVDGPMVPQSDEFELKRPIIDLFDELARLQNGTVIRLEFRHGLPFLLETVTAVSPSSLG